MDKIDTVVIGAGVVGLACARALAQAGQDVMIVEQESAIGQHTSSRNSEVIHAGIYYAHGSHKARLCVTGRDMLYRYCAERAIPHQRIGKLLVAVDAADTDRLAALQQHAAANGVTLSWLDQAALREREPALHAHAALHSPDTGIIDSHALMQALLADGGFLVHDHDVAPGLGQRPGTGQPYYAGADNQGVEFIHIASAVWRPGRAGQIPQSARFLAK
jgi:L-2-hydroxyglutarate oxidase LhgO